MSNPWRTRLVPLLGAFALIFSIAACSGGPSGDAEQAGASPASNKPLAGKKIGVSPYWLDSANLLYTNTMKEYLGGLGAEVTVLNPNGDAAKQRADVNSFMTGQYDAVILCPVNTASSVPLLRQLQGKNIRTALFWNVPTDAELQGLTAPVFTLNDYETFKEAGAQAAKYVPEMMGQAPKAIIFDDPSNPVLNARARGFEDGLKAADPQAQILFRDKVESSVDGARTKMADLLTSYPEANIVIPDNGQEAIGAYAALKAAGRGKAENKKALTEYFLLTDADSATMGLFLDPSTSAIDLVQPQPKDGGLDVGKVVETMLLSDDWKSMNDRVVVPSRLMAHDCPTATQQYEQQNATLPDYKAITCTTS